ncbi:MAG: hypothetical protein AAGA87_04340 [Pseudomonadota bacterium]
MVSRLALLIALLPCTAMAQAPEPGQDMARMVIERTRALFAVLPSGSGARVRSFFAAPLLERTTDEQIYDANEKISETAGGILGYEIHHVTFFPREETLLAGVDFSGSGANGSLVCGFLMWSMPTADEIGLMRIDQSVVERAIFVRMEYARAEDALSKFRCHEEAATAFLASLPSAPKR